MTTTIRKEGNEIVIRMDAGSVHSLLVALQPCPCKGAKSITTENIRQRLSRALAKAMGQT